MVLVGSDRTVWPCHSAYRHQLEESRYTHSDLGYGWACKAVAEI